MLKYKELNVNPKGRKTGDCSTRALVSTIGISYETALNEQCEAAKKTFYGITDKQVMEYVLKKYGWVKMKQPRKADNKKYLVKEIDQIVSKKNLNDGILVTVAGHHTCCKGNNIIDIWDCGDMTVGNYYIKI